MTKTLKELLGKERIREYIYLDFHIRMSLYLGDKNRLKFVEPLYEQYGPSSDSDVKVKRGYPKDEKIYVLMENEGIVDEILVGEIPRELRKSPLIQKPFDLEEMARKRQPLESTPCYNQFPI